MKNTEFRKRLKDIMTYRKITTQELAEKSGVKKATINNYLMNDPREPGIYKTMRIAETLDVSMEYLVTGREKTRANIISDDVEILEHDFSLLTRAQKDAVMQMTRLLAESSGKKHGKGD
ncbi:MAG: helix-turn-helix transcriptional regulator [Treponema sp.]|nr:helix-turn-helix transcriptional regulator [Treponema sp.]